MQPAESQKTILNLGSGNKSFAEAINVDITQRTHPDVVHDLNRRPWPFPDNQFMEVRAYDVLEHLDSVLAAMEEIHRVAKAGATVNITVPHFSSANAFTDPTHQQFFSYFSMDYFTDGHATAFYSPARFRVRKTSLIFHPSLINKIVWRWANRYPARYEQRWAWIFPAWYLHYELEVRSKR